MLNLKSLLTLSPARDCSTPASDSAVDAARSLNAYGSRFLAIAVLVFILVVGLPLFVRMPLWVDATHYDVCARNVLGGGIHYRDTFDTNLPGAVWLHTTIRACFGWRTETLRVADFILVAAVVWLMTRWLRAAGHSASVQTWTAAALFSFYFYTSEHCHCQRDMWMLLPAMGALWLRRRQLIRLGNDASPVRQVMLGGVVEGVLWGAAFWIKPFVAVPALLCWLLTAWLTWKRRSRTRALATDAVAVLAGGLIAGSIGSTWLWWTETWPYMWEIILHWLPEYNNFSQAPIPMANTLVSLAVLIPWSVMHLMSMPVAVARICQASAASPRSLFEGQLCPAAQEALLGIFYLGWLFQAAFLQHGFLYHHASAVFLSLAIVPIGWRDVRRWSFIGQISLGGLVVIAVLSHPLLKWERVSLWSRCLQEWSDAELRDRLAMEDVVNWENLERVEHYLREQELRDGELTCFGVFTIPLYEELGLTPSTRFIQFSSFLRFFQARHGEIHNELAQSPQRFAVTDVRDWWSCGLSSEDAEAEWASRPLALPPAFPQSLKEHFPWSEPVVFRAGQYFVHRVTGPVEEFHHESNE